MSGHRYIRVPGLLLAAFVAVVVVLTATGGVASAQGPIAKPTLTANGGIDGDVLFQWDSDANATSWQVDAAAGTICDEPSGNQVTCRTADGGDGPVCASVRGVSANRTSKFSNWLCASADPFYLDGEYAERPFSLGRTPAGEGLAPRLWDDCIVDLAFEPHRYLCTTGPTAQTETAAGIASATVDTDRVFWIGSRNEVPIVDFNPEQLRSNLRYDREPSENPEAGGPFREVHLITNRGDRADAVGLSVGVSRFILGANVVVANTSTSLGCRVVRLEGRSSTGRCFLGTLEAGDEPVRVTVSGTIDPDITDAQLKELRSLVSIDSDTPGEDIDNPAGSTEDLETDDPLFPSLDHDDDVSCIEITIRCFIPTIYSTPGEGSTSSHPNLVTFDRRRYIFHGAGDYVLARSLIDDFEVQVRFGRMSSNTVSFNQAVAARVGDSVISFGDDNSLAFQPAVVRLDGEVITPTSTPIELPDGATIEQRDGRFWVRWADGTLLRVGLRIADPWTLRMGEDRWGRVEGLLGNADGNTKNDLVSADGAPFEFSSMELYDIFGASWLRDEDTTMFLSELDPNARLPIVPGGVITLADLPPAAVERAEQLCRAGGVEEGAGLAECIFDVALTGDIRWITGLKFVNSIFAQSISLLAERGLIEDDQQVSAPTIVNGSIDNSGSADLYRFNVEAGQAVAVTSSTVCTSPWTFEFALETPSGEYVGRSAGPNCGRLGVFDVPETGEYVLRVYDANGYTGAYSLQIGFPETEVQVLEFDFVTTGVVEPFGESRLIFNVPQDDTELFFDVETCDVFGQAQLIAEDGTILRSGGCRSDYTQVLDIGTYVWRFYSTRDRGNNFRVRVWEIPERESFDLVLGEVTSGGLSFPTDRHVYRFTIDADATSVVFDNQTCNLFNRWGLRVAGGASDLFNTGCRSDVNRVLNAGEYVLTIYSNTDDFGNYSFEVREQ